MIEWTEDEIIALVQWSKEVYRITIPEAREVYELMSFLREMRRVIASKVKFEVSRVVKCRIKYTPFGFSNSRTETLDVPKLAADMMYNPIKCVLNHKCDYLAKLCNYKSRLKHEEITQTQLEADITHNRNHFEDLKRKGVETYNGKPIDNFIAMFEKN